MSKYMELYGVPVSHFLNEEANVRAKLKLVTQQIGKLIAEKRPYSYENSCVMHELEQAKAWCTKIIQDTEEV